MAKLGLPESQFLRDKEQKKKMTKKVVKIEPSFNKAANQIYPGWQEKRGG